MKTEIKFNEPIYIKAMLNGRQISITDPIDQLNQWFNFCKWVLSHNDEDQKEDVTYSDESKTYPSWQSSRRAVVDFIEDCIKAISKQNITPEEQIIQHIIEVSKMLCTQFDKGLDQIQPTVSFFGVDQDEVLKNPNDYLHEAVNNTRSRALEQLIQFGYYIKKYNPKKALEILSFLKERLKADAKPSFTLPEYAILGDCYGYLYNTDEEWTVQNKSKLFPQKYLEKWQVAFGMVLQKSPHTKIFKVFKDDFTFVVENLMQIKSDKDATHNDMIDDLGRHLWIYYLREVYPLKGSLLEKFYQKTGKGYWKTLFDLIGRQLKDHSNEFDEAMTKRVIEFFNWRLKAKEPSEFQKFSLWLEAECLDIKWRLDQYSKILDICQNTENSLDIWWYITILHKILIDHTKQVMTCFEKLTRPIISGVMLPLEDTKAILEVGLNNDDKEILSDATLALDHLLKAGCFEFLDMENK